MTKEGCVICRIHSKLYLHAYTKKQIHEYVYARDVAIEGSKALVIKANDTDIVVIAVSLLPQLQEIGVETLWSVLSMVLA